MITPTERTMMTPAQVDAELTAISERRRELTQMQVDSGWAAQRPEQLRERAQLGRREQAAWDALDLSDVADGPVHMLLLRAAMLAAVRGQESAERWDKYADEAESLAVAEHAEARVTTTARYGR